MKLFKPILLGEKQLKNHIVMAPMTRGRATPEGIVQGMTAIYYGQRATAGLIITEATNISQQATGSPFTPGIYNQEQIIAWKKVTEEVHTAGGTIYMQLWHTGRVGHSIDRNGTLPVAPSAISIPGQQHFTTHGLKPYEVPAELSTSEIKQIIEDYRQAAINANEAGFDGVELHSAFGYLPNQFLVDGANKRTDGYGGSVFNRSRFVLEVMEALISVWGPDKVGIKLSPSNYFNGMTESDPVKLYNYLIGELNEMPLAYLHLMQPMAMFPLDAFPQYPRDVLTAFAKLFERPIMVNSGYTMETAESELIKGRAELVSFGTLYIANPDLVERFKRNADLNQPDQTTMYGGQEKGYIDYSFLKA